MNAARNAQRQAGQYNDILAQQAMQQQQQFQSSLPAYNQILDYFSRRANLGGYTPAPYDQSSYNPQPVEQFKPLEIGGEKYHGLGQRITKQQQPALYGKGDPTVGIRSGVGAEHSIEDQPQPPQVPQPQDPAPQQYTRQFGSNKGTRYTREGGALTGQGDINGRLQQPPKPLQVNAGVPGMPAPQAGAPIQQPAINQQLANRNAARQDSAIYTGVTPRTGGVSDNQLGPWNNGEDRLRLAQAQEGIDRYQQQQQNLLRHNLGQRGMLNSGVYAAGSRQLGENALQQYADFRRQQAIGAGTEEERRVQQFLAALAPGMGFGGQAAQTLQGLGAQQQGQAQQSNQALQNLFMTLGQWLTPQPGAIKPTGFSGGRSNNYSGGLGGL